MENLTRDVNTLAVRLLQLSRLKKGDLFVVGCSTSEIGGETIGTKGSLEAAEAVLNGILALLAERGIYLAAQCCEHLNRALVIEQEAAAAYGLAEVNAVPVLKAGGAFAAAAYKAYKNPVLVESLEQRAKAGIDIGGTLIGMHLTPVVVPVRLDISKIGGAAVICARSRPKYIGGERARYNDKF